MRRMTLRNRDGTPYLKRWRLFECPWFGVLLHRIDGPDVDRALHDHPWAFVSFVLRGHYIEELPQDFEAEVVTFDGNVDLPGYHFDRARIHKGRDVRWLNVKRAADLHRIAWVKRGTWTLVLHGPKNREWGFATDDGWRQHDHYFQRAVSV